MKLALYASLLVPLFSMFMGLRTGKYGWNCLLTLSCALIVVLTGRGERILPLVLALAVSVVGDYFMAHKAGRTLWYILGIGGFLIAHGCFLWYSTVCFQGSPRVWIAGGALLVLYALYMVKRVLPNVNEAPMRVAVSVYALVSVASVVAAAGMAGTQMESLLYTLGIMLIAFSDTMIAESDFVRNKEAAVYIMPSYYLCHIVVTASTIFGIT